MVKIKLGGMLLTGLLILLSGCIIQEKEINSDIKIAKDYMANVSVDGGFVVLDDASQIPHRSGNLKDPANYKNVIRAPTVVNLTSYSKVALYAWTYKGGLVSKWDLTIKNSKISFVRADAEHGLH